MKDVYKEANANDTTDKPLPLTTFQMAKSQTHSKARVVVAVAGYGQASPNKRSVCLPILHPFRFPNPEIPNYVKPTYNSALRHKPWHRLVCYGVMTQTHPCSGGGSVHD
eukprot:scaffold145664_cov16-Prasinocladus_malaysianus.AAC.1